MFIRTVGAALLAAAVLVSPALAQTPNETPTATTSQWELNAGGDYSTGRYGYAADTRVSDARLGAKVQMTRLRLEAVLPYVAIDGPGELVNGVPVSGATTARTRRSGVGDFSLIAAYRISEPREHRPTFELGGSMKIPTAKSGIGTKQADYGLQSNAYGNLTEKVSYFGSLGYSWLGDSAIYQFRNGVTAMAGLNLAPDALRNLGVSLAYRAPLASAVKSQVTFTPYLTQRFAKDWGLTVYVTAGMTDASPRAGAGLSISWFPG